MQTTFIDQGVNNKSHFCVEHNTRFYKNEKVDPMGQTRIWYSHKKLDGSGFCVETNAISTVSSKGIREIPNTSVNGMFICNAMNNAVVLACNNKIQVDQIGVYFKRILSELNRTIQ